MAKYYCNYGIYDENTSKQLEEDDEIEKLTYRDDDGNRKIMTNLYILTITENYVVFESTDDREITIPINDIISWDD